MKENGRNTDNPETQKIEPGKLSGMESDKFKQNKLESDKLKLHRLEKAEVLSTRKLWEEVFSEDSREFVDYYYRNKAPENTAFVWKDRGEVISMLHLTPYNAIFNSFERKEREVSYIVGVATKEAWRQKGCMRKLLCEAFSELHKREEPFAFLMPADPKIYSPFSFEYIYERKEYFLHEGKLSEEKVPEGKLHEGKQSEEKLSEEKLVWLAEDNSRSISFPGKQEETYTMRLATANDIGRLAVFAEAVLAEEYDFYLKHTEQYFKVLLKEIESQKGGIFLFEKKGKLSAYGVCALDGSAPFFQELLYEKEEKTWIETLFGEKEKKKPVIMARVTHVEAMLSLLESQEEKQMLLEIRDKELPANEGVFLWNMGRGYSKVRRLSVKERLGTQVRVTATIKELTRQIFTGSCGNPALEEAWQGVHIYGNGMINEIV